MKVNDSLVWYKREEDDREVGTICAHIGTLCVFMYVNIHHVYIMIFNKGAVSNFYTESIVYDLCSRLVYSFLYS